MKSIKFLIAILTLLAFKVYNLSGNTIGQTYTTRKNFKGNVNDMQNYLISKKWTKNKYDCMAKCTQNNECISCGYTNNLDSSTNCYLYNNSMDALNQSSSIVIELYIRQCK